MAESFASSSTQTGHNVRPPAAVSIAVRTLGCKVNQVESEAITADLLGMGCVLAAEEDARVVIVNSCTVTAEADRKVRKLVRHALGGAARPTVVVTGCLARLDGPGIVSLGERVVVEPDSSRVVERVANLLDEFSEAAPEPASVGVTTTGEPAIGAMRHTRAMLKVQDGCDAFCAYCIVPYARGVPRSLPLEDVLVRARQLVSAGTQEIVLTGINLGRYDAVPGGLAELYRAVAATGVARLRLSSIEPLDVDDALLVALAETPATCRHLHVPLQSGSDSVLARMGRGYTVGEYESRMAAAHEALAGLVLTTDVIAGLPGETDEDAADTRETCERVGFAKLHVFRYSQRAGTAAAEMPGHVDPGERSCRARTLRSSGDRLRAAFLDSQIGAHVEVLVEAAVSDRAATLPVGTTREYSRVEIEGTHALAGDLVDVEIVGVGTCAELRGRVR